MYLSHPVRRRRDDPDPEATVALVVGPEDGAVDDVHGAIEDLDGAVTERTQFDRLVAEVPETAVASLCERDDIERIETAATLGYAIADEE